MIFTPQRLKELFNTFNTKSIAIIGDVMLDKYIWGTVGRISPEAPVPVVDVEAESAHPGGASNVALNVRNLGARPLLFGVVGNDNHAEQLKKIFDDTNISSDFLVEDTSRPTTVKTRVIAHSQHVVRIDNEVRQTISEKIRDEIIKKFEQHIDEIAAVIFQDYNKGVIDKRIIHSIIDLTKRRNIPVCVDPKFQNFFEYEGVDVFKPNRKETEDVLQIKMHNDEEYIQAARVIIERLNCKNVLLTLGERGMLLYQSDGFTKRIPTRARKVADVSGAGDTVIATLSVMIASGAAMLEAAAVANIAGGLVCEESGIVPVDKNQLYESTLTFNHLD